MFATMGSCIARVKAAACYLTFFEKYELGEELGRGHFATILGCTNKRTQAKCAVKVMSLRHLELARVESELLRRVTDHPNILTLIDFFEEDDAVFIVTNVCTGGDLFTQIVNEGRYSERSASQVMRQIVSAVDHMHTRGLAHRDLKPENILLLSPSCRTVQVADFGLSKAFKDKSDIFRTPCGTWAYCAPEVSDEKSYTCACDLWTLGILMFILLAGYHPFDVYGDLTEAKLIQKMKKLDYEFDEDVWQHTSEDAKDIIRSLLKLNADERASCTSLLETEWMKGIALSDEIRTTETVNLRRFSFQGAERDTGAPPSRGSLVKKCSSSPTKHSVKGHLKAFLSSKTRSPKKSLTDIAKADELSRSAFSASTGSYSTVTYSRSPNPFNDDGSRSTSSRINSQPQSSSSSFSVRTSIS